MTSSRAGPTLSRAALRARRPPRGPRRPTPACSPRRPSAQPTSTATSSRAAAASNFRVGVPAAAGRAPRRALSAVYAFCRSADDLADEARRRGGRSRGASWRRWRDELAAAYDGTPDASDRHRARRRRAALRHPPRALRGGPIAGVEMDTTARPLRDVGGQPRAPTATGSRAPSGFICIEIIRLPPEPVCPARVRGRARPWPSS